MGADFEFIRPDTEGTIQTDEGIDAFGAYIQSSTALTQKLDFHGSFARVIIPM